MSAFSYAPRPPGATPAIVKPPGPAGSIHPHAVSERVIDGPAFRDLLSLKRRIVGPMLVGSMAFFLTVLALTGYARPLMATKVAGPLNFGYVLVLAIYGMCWALAILYAFVADTRFDPQAARAVAEQEVRS